MTYKKPELLIPASSLEVLKTAVIFGADAVYIGGETFSLRAKAKNFSHEDMKEGIAFAHAHGVRVHVTANILADVLIPLTPVICHQMKPGALYITSGILDVKEELQHVRSYLEIQQMRYQDILQYEICVPEELNHCQIPKITLQPLVENALYHGIKNKRGKGMIRIEGELDGENCILLITDNGKGMTPERLEQVRKGIRNRKVRETDIYGLYNVNERIRLNFGENYGITITSTYGEGTCVTVRLPQH